MLFNFVFLTNDVLHCPSILQIFLCVITLNALGDTSFELNLTVTLRESLDFELEYHSVTIMPPE